MTNGPPMARRSRLKTALIHLSELVALLAWTSLAFWTFSFSFSSSFFHYNLHSRLPPFVAAVLGAVAIPVSGYVQWRRLRRGAITPLRAFSCHVLVTAGSLAPLMVVAAVLARAPAPWHLSGDDAMGIGIDWLLLLGLAVLSLPVVAAALALGRTRPRDRDLTSE